MSPKNQCFLRHVFVEDVLNGSNLGWTVRLPETTRKSWEVGSLPSLQLVAAANRITTPSPPYEGDW